MPVPIEEYNPMVLGINHTLEVHKIGEKPIPDFRFVDATKEEINNAIANGSKDIAVECSPESIEYYGEIRNLINNRPSDYLPPEHLPERERENLTAIHSTVIKHLNHPQLGPFVLMGLGPTQRFWYNVLNYLEKKGATVHPLGHQKSVTEATTLAEEAQEMHERGDRAAPEKLDEAFKLNVTEAEYKLRLNSKKLIDKGINPGLFIIGEQHHSGIRVALREKGIHSRKRVFTGQPKDTPHLTLKRKRKRLWREYSRERKTQLSRLDTAMANLSNKRKGKPHIPK